MLKRKAMSEPPDDGPDEDQTTTVSHGTWSSKKTVTRFNFGGTIKDHISKPLFGVQFNPYDPSEATFAVAGGPRVVIYRCRDDNGIDVVQVLKTKDPKEDLYTCAWTLFTSGPLSGTALLAVAGLQGAVNLINVAAGATHKVLVGHGGPVNELRVHPNNGHLLFSCSRDCSVRMWNLLTDSVVAIFGGHDAHLADVLSIDVHLSGEWLVSSGMDNAVKIWPLKTERIQNAIAASFERDPATATTTFKPIIVHFTQFSTTLIHRNYVDCVRYFGDLLLSKSIENRVVLWKAETNKPPRNNDGIVSELLDFRMQDCEVWFIRFGVDPTQRLLYCGNTDGKIFVWDIDVITRDRNSLHLIARNVGKLAHSRCRTTVRQVAVSASGQRVIAVCHGGAVWRWDVASNDGEEAHRSPST